MVWLAAWFGLLTQKPFLNYALLGDYNIIGNRAVAEKCSELVGILDVSISESKSIDSRVHWSSWVRKVQVHLTPISAKAVLSASTLIGLCQLAEKYSLSRSC